MTTQDQILSHYKQVSRWALTLTRDEDDAADLTQEVMMKAMKGAGSFQPGTNIQAWMYRITKNEFINSRRRGKLLEVVSIDDVVESPLSEKGAADGYQNVTCEAIERVIDTLPERLRDTIRLIVSGHKYDEIAQILNMPEGTVKSRIYIARKELSSKLNYAY